MQDNQKFEDKAWENMKMILDDKLPQEKIVWWKRYALFLLLFLLFSVGTLSYFISTKLADNQNIVQSSIDMSNHHKDPENTENLPIPIVQNSANSAFSELIQINQEIQSEQLIRMNEKAISTNLNSNLNAENSIKLNKSTILNDSKISKINSVENSFLYQSSKQVESKSIFAPDTKGLSNNAETQNNPQSLIFAADINKISPSSLTSELNEKSLTNTENLLFIGSDLLEIKKSDFLQVQSHAINLPILKVAEADRTNSLYAFTEFDYFSTAESFNFKIGLLSEIGSTDSRWNFSTGVFYQQVNFNSSNLGRTADLEDLPLIGSSVEEQVNFDTQKLNYLRNVDYIGIPLIFSYKINRFKIALGLENYFTVNKTFGGGLRNELYLNEKSSYDLVNLYNVLLFQQVSYRMSNRWDIGLGFHFALNKAHEYPSDYRNKLDHAALSLKYRIFTKN